MGNSKKSEILDIYGKQAEDYQAYVKDSFSWKYLERPVFDEGLKDAPLKDATILDAGCGDGRVIQYLLERGAREGNITGVDVSENMANESKKRFPKAHVVHADTSDPKLELGRFDLITASMFLFYLENNQFQQTLANFYKWLNEGGILVFVTTHPIRVVQDDLSTYFRRGWRKLKSPWGTENPNFHRTLADYINMTTEAGFTIERIIEPELPEEAKENKDDYKKYSAYPCRLGMRARR